MDVCGLSSEWRSEDHRPEEEHLQAGSGRVHRTREDRERVRAQRTRGPGLCSWGQSSGKGTPVSLSAVHVRPNPTASVCSPV